MEEQDVEAIAERNRLQLIAHEGGIACLDVETMIPVNLI